MGTRLSVTRMLRTDDYTEKIPCIFSALMFMVKTEAQLLIKANAYVLG